VADLFSPIIKLIKIEISDTVRGKEPFVQVGKVLVRIYTAIHHFEHALYCRFHALVPFSLGGRGTKAAKIRGIELSPFDLSTGKAISRQVMAALNAEMRAIEALVDAERIEKAFDEWIKTKRQPAPKKKPA